MTAPPVSEVATLAELLALDGDEILEGYIDGHGSDAPEPGPNRSRAYRHGWYCRQVDKGRVQASPAHRALAAAYIQFLKGNK